MITEELVKRIIHTSYEDIPENVLNHAKQSLLNWVGVTVGASHHETIDILIKVTDTFSSKSQASLLGRNQKKDLLSAVLINGVSSHIFDYDDTHLETIHHPSGPVAPVIFALGEMYEISPKELLRAFVLGCETELRISNAVYPSHYDNGYHITSSTGVFGAAVAAGILLKLDKEQMAMSLGIAGTQSFGLREMFGTMTKPFHTGKAAQNGLLSALLAKEGFTSSKQVLEAKRGFANVYSRESDLSKVLIHWGKVWEFEKNTFKPYACGIVLHPAIDACIQLGQYATAEEVSGISLEVHPYVLELTGKENPTTGLEGKFSIYHSAAIAFLEKDASEKEFHEAKINHPNTIEFRKKIKPVANKSIGKDKALARLTKLDGSVHEIFIEHATGSLKNPMTETMLHRKFSNLCRGIISEQQVGHIIEAMQLFEKLDSINELIHMINRDLMVSE